VVLEEDEDVVEGEAAHQLLQRIHVGQLQLAASRGSSSLRMGTQTGQRMKKAMKTMRTTMRRARKTKTTTMMARTRRIPTP
jgi:hypothetical protein